MRVDVSAGAFFETAQTIRNKYNATMEQICENGTPIVVFVAGRALPHSCYDPRLKKSIGEREEQSMYMGVYNVLRCAQDPPLMPSSLTEIKNFYKSAYGGLELINLRFLLEVSKKFRLVPNEDYKQKLGGYHHLEVDTRDNRKPMFELPSHQTFNNILRAMPLRDEEEEETSLFVSQRSMFRNWAKCRGYLEFMGETFCGAGEATVRQNENSFIPRPLPPDAAVKNVAVKMAHCSKGSKVLRSTFKICFVRALDPLQGLRRSMWTRGRGSDHC